MQQNQRLGGRTTNRLNSPQQPLQEQNERNNQRHKRKPHEQRMNGTTSRRSTQPATASPKTANEQSNPNTEKTAKKLSEVMKCLSGSQSDAESMTKASCE
jgi:hypothetical protein